ncbi:hypothetical protein VVMO6_03014 [Vibrio vulnificus MO6-24/O]|nr:hypothetical protein VVMO6_03014 [Vibrio vulnificus MO6-24/O]
MASYYRGYCYNFTHISHRFGFANPLVTKHTASGCQCGAWG